ncbi:MAG: hypothetical protein K2N30_04125, partial [Clostridia bacterium]|nr:hypothetical protein [Clostridia bacterium]
KKDLKNFCIEFDDYCKQPPPTSSAGVTFYYVILFEKISPRASLGRNDSKAQNLEKQVRRGKRVPTAGNVLNVRDQGGTELNKA